MERYHEVVTYIVIAKKLEHKYIGSNSDRRNWKQKFHQGRSNVTSTQVENKANTQNEKPYSISMLTYYW
jgi:hypothetical protein